MGGGISFEIIIRIILKNVNGTVLKIAGWKSMMIKDAAPLLTVKLAHDSGVSTRACIFRPTSCPPLSGT